MARTKIGEATTNASGIASFTYTGTGAGELDIIAKVGDVESNVVSIDDYVQDVTSMTFTGDKSIIQTGDTVTLTATVLDQYGVGIDGESVVFKIGSTTLDTVTTSDGGVATVSYTGQGTGQLNFSAECMNVSKTYSIWDTIKYDNAIQSSHNNIWNVSSSDTSFVRGEEYTTFSKTVTGNKYAQFNISEQSICVEFEVYQATGYRNNIFFRVSSSTEPLYQCSLQNISHYIGEWVKCRLTMSNGTVTFEDAEDSTKKHTATYTGDIATIQFALLGSESTELRFKNFKVYPI